MFDPNTIFIVTVTAVISVALAVQAWLKYKQIINEKPNTVVVYMPLGATPLEQLDPIKVTQTISPKEAVLWWTVYKAGLDNDGISLSQAIRAANSAVECVFRNNNTE